MKVYSAEFVKSCTGLKNCPDQSHPEVALAGRSNVGKSSLLNTLVGRKKLARTGKTPGRTQTINYFLVNGNLFIVDLPGYGYAKVPERVRAQWGPMVESYLQGREQLKGVILIVDIRHQPTAQDRQMCQWLRHYGLPYAIVATKCDKISRGQVQKHLAVVKRVLELEKNDFLIPFSAQTRRGKNDIWGVINYWTGERARS